MIDEKIKYGEWCAKWYQKNKNLNIKELEDEHKSRKIEDLTQKLNRKIKKILGKDYGDKHFRPISKKINFGDFDNPKEVKEMLDFVEEQENEVYRQEALALDRSNKLKEVCNETLGQKDKKSIDKREKAEYEYHESLKKGRILIQKRDDYPMGKRRRFEYLTDKEVAIFDFLLNEDNTKLLKTKNYTQEKVACYKELWDLLMEVNDNDESCDNWELTLADIEEIEIRFFYPGIKKIYKIYEKMIQDKEEDSKYEIEKKLVRIHNQIDDLYKKCFNETEEYKDIDVQNVVEKIVDKAMRYKIDSEE